MCGVELEPRPRDVDVVAERARRVAVDRDPFLVVEGRGRRRLVDEDRRAPRQRAAGAERALVDGDGVGGRRPVEPEAGVEDVAVRVERDRRVAARVVLAARQAGDARDQRPEMVRVAARAAPRRPAVVRVVRAGVAVTQGAAGRPADRAGPRPADVVVGRGHDPAGTVGVDRDRGLVLGCARGVLVDEDVGRRDRGPVERAREDDVGVDRGRRAGRRRVFVFPGFFLEERREADLEAGRPVQGRGLAGERRDVVLRVMRRSRVATPGSTTGARRRRHQLACVLSQERPPLGTGVRAAMDGRARSRRARSDRAGIHAGPRSRHPTTDAATGPCSRRGRGVRSGRPRPGPTRTGRRRPGARARAGAGRRRPARRSRRRSRAGRPTAVSGRCPPTRPRRGPRSP